MSQGVSTAPPSVYDAPPDPMQTLPTRDDGVRREMEQVILLLQEIRDLLAKNGN